MSQEIDVYLLMYNVGNSDVGSHNQGGGSSDNELEEQCPQPQPAFITTTVNDKVSVDVTLMTCALILESQEHQCSSFLHAMTHTCSFMYMHLYTEITAFCGTCYPYQVIRSSDICVSERTPLNTLILKPYKPIWNELTGEVSSLLHVHTLHA